MNINKNHLVDLLILTIALLVSLTVGASAAPYSGSYPYKASATTGMIGDIVKQVAGDKAQVTVIIGPGVDPHVYKASRNDMVTLTRSQVIFYNGLHLEGQMGDILGKIGKQRPVYAVTELIDKAELIGDAHKADPHVWMDVAKWSSAVQAVSKSLSEFDPTHAPVYATNAARYQKDLGLLSAYSAKVLASIPEKQRTLITAHDAFSYLGKAYGIKVLGIQGLSTESEAGLQDINRLVDLIVDNQIPAVFVESSVPDKNVRALVEGARSRGQQIIVGGELFSDAMGSADTYEGTYIGMIDHNVTIIARSLGGQAPEKGMQNKLRIEN
jgi:manganese/zinc/iron transport system substrate-binding protein